MYSYRKVYLPKYTEVSQCAEPLFCQTGLIKLALAVPFQGFWDDTIVLQAYRLQLHAKMSLAKGHRQFIDFKRSLVRKKSGDLNLVLGLRSLAEPSPVVIHAWQWKLGREISRLTQRPLSILGALLTSVPKLALVSGSREGQGTCKPGSRGVQGRLLLIVR